MLSSRSLLRGSALLRGAQNVRTISTNTAPRISAVAMGKRPAIHFAMSLQTRHLSWGRSTAPVTNQHVEILQDPHPDLQDTVRPEAVNTSLASTPLSSVDTSVPSSINTSTPSSIDTSLPDLAYSSRRSLERTQPVTEAVDTTDVTLITPADHLADLVALNPNVPLDTLLHSPEAASAAAALRDLPAIGLDHAWYSLPGWTADALLKLHDLTGLPWWGTIVVMSVALRLFLFPTVIDTQRETAKMAIYGPRMKALQAEIGLAKKEGDSVRASLQTQELVKYIKENDIKVLASLKPLVIQIPLLTSMFFGISRLAGTPLPGLLHEGFGWVRDLTVPDPLYILPIMTLAFQNLAMRSGADGETNGHAKNWFFVASFGIFLFVKGFPAALLMYWTTAASVTCLQAYILKLPAVRARLRLPARAVSTTKQPTFKETAATAVKWYKDRQAAGLVAAEQRLLEMQQKERAKGLKSGTALMVTEKIVKGGKVETPKRAGGIVQMVREGGGGVDASRGGKPKRPQRGV